MKETGKIENIRKYEETMPLVLAGKYELREVIGEGGSGVVYLAWDRNLERLTAIKAAKVDEEELKTEMEMLKKLKHPMLPELYDYFYAENGYLVMEYIEGESLHKVIEREGQITEKQAILWAEQILQFLTFLHEQKQTVIYRDLKPENIIVCPDGKIRFVDFGAAFLLHYDGTGQSRMAGTIGYAAPEQWETDNLVGNVLEPSSDIYTFGALLYHMLTGYHPAHMCGDIRLVRTLNPVLSKGIEAVVEKCTRTEKEKRYQTAKEVEKDLQRVAKTGRTQGKWTDFGRRNRILKKMEKKIWLTDKKSVGLFLAGLGVVLLFFLGMTVPYYAKEKEAVLPVLVYNKQGQKIVIRYDSIYETQGNLVLELEEKLFAGEGMQELSVALTDCSTGQKKERIFYLQGHHKKN